MSKGKVVTLLNGRFWDEMHTITVGTFPKLSRWQRLLHFFGINRPKVTMWIKRPTR